MWSGCALRDVARRARVSSTSRAVSPVHRSPERVSSGSFRRIQCPLQSSSPPFGRPIVRAIGPTPLRFSDPSTASRELAPSWSEAFPLAPVPPSGFHTPSAVSAGSRHAALFHAATVPGFPLPSELHRAGIARRSSRRASCLAVILPRAGARSHDLVYPGFADARALDARWPVSPRVSECPFDGDRSDHRFPDTPDRRRR
jgi:hypothetical protein